MSVVYFREIPWRSALIYQKQHIKLSLVLQKDTNASICGSSRREERAASVYNSASNGLDVCQYMKKDHILDACKLRLRHIVVPLEIWLFGYKSRTIFEIISWK